MKTKRHYRKWTDNDLTEAVRISRSISEVLRKIGLKTAGGSHRNIEDNIARLQLDCSHFTGQKWSSGLFLKEYNNYKGSENCRKKLLNERGNQCEGCQRKTWNKQPIMVELHHIDGDHRNNHKENLLLMCPNCHSQTDNWKGRK